MISACILTLMSCEIEGSSIDQEDPTIDIKDLLYPKVFNTCTTSILGG